MCNKLTLTQFFTLLLTKLLNTNHTNHYPFKINSNKTILNNIVFQIKQLYVGYTFKFNITQLLNNENIIIYIIPN